MTKTQFLRLLQVEVDKFPTRWRAAEHLHLSESALSRVINRKQEPSDELLDYFGLTRQTQYVKALTVDKKINPADNCAAVEG